jgi:hypothetical protein
MTFCADPEACGWEMAAVRSSSAAYRPNCRASCRRKFLRNPSSSDLGSWWIWRGGRKMSERRRLFPSLPDASGTACFVADSVHADDLVGAVYVLAEAAHAHVEAADVAVGADAHFGTAVVGAAAAVSTSTSAAAKTAGLVSRSLPWRQHPAWPRRRLFFGTMQAIAGLTRR